MAERRLQSSWTAITSPRSGHGAACAAFLPDCLDPPAFGKDRPANKPAGASTNLKRRTPPVEIYLPIADIPVNLFLLFFMGIAVGFISGMFGIGGGLLKTALLIFICISPSVAVARGGSR